MHERRCGPRERLGELGAERLSDTELVSILLGTGSRKEPVSVLAARLLAEAGGIACLEELGLAGLAAIRGVGPTKACRLVAALELGRRAAAVPLERAAPIVSSRDVDRALRPRLARADVEHFLMIPTDAKNRPLGEVWLAKGGLSACPVSPADAYRTLLRRAASGVVFVHNHPSGEPTPSPDDVSLTERLTRAGELLGIRVLDHVIVAREGYFSFLDAGLLPASREAA